MYSIEEYINRKDRATLQWKGYKDCDNIWSRMSLLTTQSYDKNNVVIGTPSCTLEEWKLCYILSTFVDTAGCKIHPLYPISHLVSELFEILYMTESFITGPIMHQLTHETAVIRLYYPTFKNSSTILRYVTNYVLPHMDIELIPYHTSINTVVSRQPLTCEMAAFNGKTFITTNEYIFSVLTGYTHYNHNCYSQSAESIEAALESGFMISLPKECVPTGIQYSTITEFQEILNSLNTACIEDYSIVTCNYSMNSFLGEEWPLTTNYLTSKIDYILDDLHCMGIGIEEVGYALSSVVDIGQCIIATNIVHSSGRSLDRRLGRSSSRTSGRSLDRRLGRSSSRTSGRSLDRRLGRSSGSNDWSTTTSYIAVFAPSYNALQYILMSFICCRIVTPISYCIIHTSLHKYIEIAVQLSNVQLTLYSELPPYYKLRPDNVWKWVPLDPCKSTNPHPLSRCLSIYCERINSIPSTYYFIHSGSVITLH